MGTKPIATLTVFTTSGNQQLSQKELQGDSGTITIGRHAENDLCIPSIRLSAKHAEFGWKDGKVWVIDLESKYGTTVGTIKITDTVYLKDGDVAVLGDVIRIEFKLQNDDIPEITVEPDAPAPAPRTSAPSTPSRARLPPPPPTLAAVVPPPPLPEVTIASGPPLFDAGETTPVETLLVSKPKPTKKWAVKVIMTLIIIAIATGVYAARHLLADFVKKNAATMVSTEPDSEGTMGAWLSGNERDGGIEIKLSNKTVNDLLEKPSDMRRLLNPPDLNEPAKDLSKASAASASTKPAEAAPGKTTVSKHPPGCFAYKIQHEDYWEAVMWAAGHDKNEKDYTDSFKKCNPGVKPHVFKDGDEIWVDKEDLTHDEVIEADRQIQVIKAAAAAKRQRTPAKLDKSF